MDHDGPGVIRHMWFTMRSGEFFRNIILRIYWDGEETPSVELPYRRFFLQFVEYTAADLCTAYQL